MQNKKGKRSQEDWDKDTCQNAITHKSPGGLHPQLNFHAFVIIIDNH